MAIVNPKERVHDKILGMRTWLKGETQLLRRNAVITIAFEKSIQYHCLTNVCRVSIAKRSHF